MGDFSNSTKWKLVNDFTIHEDRKLRDRPYMLTCVPKQTDVEITSFETIRFIEWPDKYGDDERPETYEDRSFIRFNGDIDDRIVVFTMADGEIETFRTLTDATIRPLPAGSIGGKHKATSFDGIDYSGMSSRDVPEKGLMAGEPGSLSYLSVYEEPRGGQSPARLSANLYLDEDKFFRLFASLADNSRPVKTFKISLLVELFESEVEASLAEPWMCHDYGLLSKGTAFARTGARIESVSISTGGTALTSDPNGEDDTSIVDHVLGVEDRAPTVAAPDPIRALLQYQRYILLALFVLIVITAFLN